MIHIVHPFSLCSNAIKLCREIAHNRKCINAETFEGYWSREATVNRTRLYEDSVIAIADTLIERASHVSQ